MSQRGSKWANWALLVAAIVFAFGLGEFAVRWRGTDLHPAAGYRFHPHYGWLEQPPPSRTGFLPSGFRSPVLDPPSKASNLAADGPRVLLLGDSFSIGIEQRWPNTFAGILAQRLGERGGRLANLSSGGWGTAQQYLALVAEGLPWQPDAVVLQVFPYNDLCNNGRALAFTCSWQDHLRPYAEATADGIEMTWLSPWAGRSRTVSRLFGLVERQLHWRGLGSPGQSRAEFNRRTRAFTRDRARRIGLEYHGYPYSLLPADEQPSVVRQAWEVTESLFTQTKRRLDEHNIPLIALVIPSSWTFDPKWEQFRERYRLPVQRDYGTAHSEAIFARLGVPVISMRQKIEGEGLDPGLLFNRVNLHLSASGHRHAAEWILAELKRIGLLR